MKKLVFFVGILFTGAAMAAVGDIPADNHSYPNFTGSSENPATNFAVREPNTKVATTNYVDSRVGDAGAGIATLQTKADTDATDVAANQTDITDMQQNRLNAITDNANACPSGQVCGYISDTNGTKKWVVIRVN